MEFLKNFFKLTLFVIGGTWLFKKTSDVYDNRKEYKQKFNKSKEIWKE